MGRDSFGGPLLQSVEVKRFKHLGIDLLPHLFQGLSKNGLFPFLLPGGFDMGVFHLIEKLRRVGLIRNRFFRPTSFAEYITNLMSGNAAEPDAELSLVLMVFVLSIGVDKRGDGFLGGVLSVGVLQAESVGDVKNQWAVAAIKQAPRRFIPEILQSQKQRRVRLSLHRDLPTESKRGFPPPSPVALDYCNFLHINILDRHHFRVNGLYKQGKIGKFIVRILLAQAKVH